MSSQSFKRSWFGQKPVKTNTIDGTFVRTQTPTRAGPPGPTVIEDNDDFERLSSTAKAPTEAEKSMATFPIFNRSDANRDGLLSRNEFADALQMFLHSEQEEALFASFTVEEIDEQFESAGGNEEEQVEITPAMFEAWLPKFRDGFLEHRRLLEDLGVQTDDLEVGLQCDVEEDMIHTVEAVGNCCRALETLTLRGNVTADVLGAVAELCGDRLRRLDLCHSTCDDEALQGLFDSGCGALEELKLVGCSDVSNLSMNALGEAVADGTTCPNLERLFVSADAMLLTPQALAALPAQVTVKQVREDGGEEELGEVEVEATGPADEIDSSMEPAVPSGGPAAVKGGSRSESPKSFKRGAAGCTIS